MSSDRGPKSGRPQSPRSANYDAWEAKLFSHQSVGPTRQELFGDLRIQYGIKVGVAGLLALFCAQVLRLQSDNWAVLTVPVLMTQQHVGAFAFRAIMRVTGTIAGALVGIWLVSDYTSTPAIFLPAFFFVMAFAGYKYGQVGARQ